MIEFERISLDELDVDEYYDFPLKSPFTTIPWIKFIMDDNKGTPIILRITESGSLVGYFSGVLVKKFGIKIVGSPFKGWSTCYMGFDLYDTKRIPSLLKGTFEYIRQCTHCSYIELVERNLKVEDAANLGYKTEIESSLEMDLDKTDEEFFASIGSSCRGLIRQFEKRGAKIEIAQPDEEFIRELYAQICEVFAKQNLVPTYSLQKIHRFVDTMKEYLMCLKVTEPGGKNIASIIYYGFNTKCFGWCTGSYGEYQWYRPNEYMVWYGLRLLRDKGFKTFDYAGVAKYKYKWNPEETHYLRVMWGKYPFLIPLRNLAKKLYWMQLKWKGYKKKNIFPNPPHKKI